MNGFKCDCNNNYTGDHCQTFDACAINRKFCKNNSTCANDNDDFTCLCNFGFNGTVINIKCVNTAYFIEIIIRYVLWWRHKWMWTQ